MSGEADLRRVRAEYIAAVKATSADPEALWVECSATRLHDPHWWWLGREEVACTGAGWA